MRQDRFVFIEKPLTEQLRPSTLEQVVGQEHLLGAGKILRASLEEGKPFSFILWGPPGSGKTTIARLLASSWTLHFVEFSAVTSGIPEVRKVIEQARKWLHQGERTMLFVDEIHRFNKAQQDAFLPHVEDGTIFLVGATTENPYFEIISPLLSRTKVLKLNPLRQEELQVIFERARELLGFSAEGEAVNLLLHYADGDARRLLLTIEAALTIQGVMRGGEPSAVPAASLARLAQSAQPAQRAQPAEAPAGGICEPPGEAGSGSAPLLTPEAVREAMQKKMLLYDKGGDYHYDLISAYIKSIRGGDPDAALHWLARMLSGGEDPRFIVRRLLILASEDIGNADPLAIVVASSVAYAVEHVGMPEAQLSLAQGTTYLACAPKSNASYRAFSRAKDDVEKADSTPEVPLHLRNPVFKGAEEFGIKGYRYPHEFPGHFIDQIYLPEGMEERVYYFPAEEGMEKEIRDRLKRWWPKRDREG